MAINNELAPCGDSIREPAEKPAPAPSGAQKLLAVGSVLGALAASSCCVLPLALFSLGVGGAWIGSLTRLAPYQPYFASFAAVCLGAGLWSTYRSRRTSCATGAGCGRPSTNRLVVTAFVVAAALIVVALAADLLVPLLFA